MGSLWSTDNRGKVSRFLEVLSKLDQVMPLLQTLEIHEIITTHAVDIERARLKRQVRNVANGARNLAMALRRRMNATGSHRPEATSMGPDDMTQTELASE